MSDAFISYSRINDDFAARLEAALLATDPPQTIWRDKSGLGPGVKWRPEVQEGIATAENFIFIITPESVRDTIPAPGITLRPCGFEIEHAVSLGKRIVPIMLEYAPSATLHPAVRECNYIDFRDPANFDTAFAKLLTALHTDTAWLHAHTRLQNRAADWATNNRDRSYLLSGADLTEAEHWLAQPAETHLGLQSTPLETEYIAASRTAETRSQKLRTRIAIAVATVSIALAAFALIQRREARRQRDTAEQEARTAIAGRLAATALNIKDTQPALAYLLSIEGFHLRPMFETRNALITLFQSTPDFIGIQPATAPGGGYLTVIAYTPDGTRFVTGSSTGALRLWNATTRQPIDFGVPPPGSQTDPDQISVKQFAFTSGGATLAVVFASGHLQLWQLSAAAPALLSQDWPGIPASPTGVAFNSDGTLLAVSGLGGIQVWSTASHRPFRKLATPDSVMDPAFLNAITSGVAFSPHDPNLLVRLGVGIEFEDAKTGASRGFIKPSMETMGGTLQIAFSPDGSELAINGNGNGEGQLALWDVTTTGARVTLKQHGLLSLDKNGNVSSLAFAPDGKTLAAATTTGTIRLWDMATLQPWRDYPGDAGEVGAIAFSPDGNLLLSGPHDGKLVVWERRQQHLIDVHGPVATEAEQKGGSDDLPENCAPRSPATTGGKQERDPMLDSMCALLARMSPEVKHRVYSEVYELAFSSDHKLLAVAGLDGVLLWDVASGQLNATIPVGDSSIHNIQFTSDNRYLIITPVKDKGPLRWDIQNKLLERLAAFDPRKVVPVDSKDGEDVYAESYSPSSGIVVSASERGIEVRNPARGATPFVFPRSDDMSYENLFLSPDGLKLAGSGGEGRDATTSRYLWDLSSGKQKRIALDQPEKRTLRLVFSSDSKRLAGVGPDGIMIWDTATGKDVGTATGELRQNFTAAAFNLPQSLLGLVIDGDQVILADDETRRPVGAPIQPHALGPHDQSVIAFSPDGKVLAYSSDGGIVHLWDADPASWAGRMCQVANRNLSLKEWQRYLGTTAPYHRTCPNLPNGEGIPSK